MPEKAAPIFVKYVGIILLSSNWVILLLFGCNEAVKLKGVTSRWESQPQKSR